MIESENLSIDEAALRPVDGDASGDAEAQGPGPARRLVAVLFSPKAAFEEINRRPTWLAPITITLVAVLAGGLFMIWRMNPDYEQIVRNRIQQRLKANPGGQVPADEVIQRRATTVKTVAEAGTLIGAFVTPIVTLTVAGLVALALFLARVRRPFGKVFSVIAWSTCAVGLVEILVRIVWVLVGDPESLRVIHPLQVGSFIPTNPSVFLSPDTAAPLKAAAYSLDLFTLWILILLAIALPVISGRKPITRRKAAGVVCGLWIALFLFNFGWEIVIGR